MKEPLKKGNKTYLPTTYVDENGEIFTKEQLKEKIYEKTGKPEVWNEEHGILGTTKVHTLQRIKNVRKKPRQLSLFSD